MKARVGTVIFGAGRQIAKIPGIKAGDHVVFSFFDVVIDATVNGNAELGFWASFAIATMKWTPPRLRGIRGRR